MLSPSIWKVFLLVIYIQHRFSILTVWYTELLACFIKTYKDSKNTRQVSGSALLIHCFHRRHPKTLARRLNTAIKQTRRKCYFKNLHWQRLYISQSLTVGTLTVKFALAEQKKSIWIFVQLSHIPVFGIR